MPHPSWATRRRLAPGLAPYRGAQPALQLTRGAPQEQRRGDDERQPVVDQRAAPVQRVRLRHAAHHRPQRAALRDAWAQQGSQPGQQRPSSTMCVWGTAVPVCQPSCTGAGCRGERPVCRGEGLAGQRGRRGPHRDHGLRQRGRVLDPKAQPQVHERHDEGAAAHARRVGQRRHL